MIHGVSAPSDRNLWNEQGGIIHWTHHNPEGNDHPDG
ncbi:MAG: DUF3465 domain-containing protein [Cyanobacteria bacterium P01_F01_bin.150]